MMSRTDATRSGQIPAIGAIRSYRRCLCRSANPLDRETGRLRHRLRKHGQLGHQLDTARVVTDSPAPAGSSLTNRMSDAAVAAKPKFLHREGD